MKPTSATILFAFIYFVNWSAIKIPTVVGQTRNSIECNSRRSFTESPKCNYIENCPFRRFKDSDFQNQANNLDFSIDPSLNIFDSHNSTKDCLYITYGTIKTQNLQFIHNMFLEAGSRISGYCAIAGYAGDESCKMDIDINRDGNPLTTQYIRGGAIPYSEVTISGKYSIAIKIYPSTTSDHQIVLMNF